MGSSIAKGLMNVGKKIKDEIKEFIKNQKELDKLKKEDYPSEKQKARIKELNKLISKQKKVDTEEKIKDTLKKTKKRKYKGKPLDMSMAMNKGGIINKKTKVGSMDYRKGGLFK